MLALAHGLSVSESAADVVDAGCELGIVVAYGRLIRPAVLERLPMLNVHFSLLPRWRGAAPVERAILAGDQETGVCVMGLEEGLDTGPVYARVVTSIDPDEHADALRNRLGEMGTTLLLDVLAQRRDGIDSGEPQQGEPTYAAKLTIEDRHLDFTSSGSICHRQVRVGRAFTQFRSRRFLIHDARLVAETLPGAKPGEIVGDLVATSQGALRPLVVQAEGRARMEFSTWRAGSRPLAGETFGP